MNREIQNPDAQYDLTLIGLNIAAPHMSDNSWTRSNTSHNHSNAIDMWGYKGGGYIMGIQPGGGGRANSKRGLVRNMCICRRLEVHPSFYKVPIDSQCIGWKHKKIID